MKTSNSSASELGTASYIVINSVSDSNPPSKPSSPPTEKPKPPNWRRLLLLLKDIGAVVLVLVKILQELGLL
jgi:hypothetical protein